MVSVAVCGNKVSYRFVSHSFDRFYCLTNGFLIHFGIDQKDPVIADVRSSVCAATACYLVKPVGYLYEFDRRRLSPLGKRSGREQNYNKRD